MTTEEEIPFLKRVLICETPLERCVGLARYRQRVRDEQSDEWAASHQGLTRC